MFSTGRGQGVFKPVAVLCLPERPCMIVFLRSWASPSCHGRNLSICSSKRRGVKTGARKRALCKLRETMGGFSAQMPSNFMLVCKTDDN
eukprot:3679163-Amphidinium_carterae.1